MMEVSASGKVDFLGESLGGYIFPSFMPAFDGMLSICKLVEYLCKERARLSDLIAEVPRVNQKKIEIPCSLEKMGTVMRRAMEMVKGIDKLETVDGLKFWRNGDWALVLPDSTLPIIHLYAEAGSERKTRMLLDKYAKSISALKGS